MMARVRHQKDATQNCAYRISEDITRVEFAFYDKCQWNIFGITEALLT